MSEQSVGDLNTRLCNPVTVYNFRPNIIVSTDKPYAEVYICRYVIVPTFYLRLSDRMEIHEK